MRSRRGALVAAAVAVAALVAGIAVLAPSRISRWTRELRLPRGENPSVVLVTLDAIRVDRVGAYGSATAVATPNLDGLAAEGVLFSNAYVQAPLGLPSHASILTGMVPSRHGVRDELSRRLAEEIPTLAERFRAAGYETAAFVGSSALAARFGLDRGFTLYDDDLGPSGKRSGRSESATASETIHRIRTWLASRDGSAPLFLWANFSDPREPYTPPPGFETNDSRTAYEGEIEYLDSELGVLVAELRRVNPETLIAVVGAHGESLGDHGEPTHGYFLYSATTHVPLILSMPRAVPSGLRVDAFVRAMDLAPTLLDAAGLPRPESWDGASLVPLIVGRTAESPGPVPLENFALERKYGMSPVFGLIEAPYLYIHAPRRELYDMSQDPAELDDASSRLSGIASEMERLLLATIPGVPDTEGLIDPKDGLSLYRRYHAAIQAESRGNLPRAVEMYEAILDENAGFAFARSKLAACLFALGRSAEAETVVHELIERDEATESSFLNIALARFRDGDAETALDWLQRGAERFPADPALRHRSGRLLLTLGRNEAAIEELEMAIGLEPDLVDAYLALGEALETVGRRNEAKAAFERVIQIGPLSDEASEAKAALERMSKDETR